jgi:hypothetical protein
VSYYLYILKINIPLDGLHGISELFETDGPVRGGMDLKREVSRLTSQFVVLSEQMRSWGMDHLRRLGAIPEPPEAINRRFTEVSNMLCDVMSTRLQVRAMADHFGGDYAEAMYATARFLVRCSLDLGGDDWVKLEITYMTPSDPAGRALFGRSFIERLSLPLFAFARRAGGFFEAEEFRTEGGEWDEVKVMANYGTITSTGYVLDFTGRARPVWDLDPTRLPFDEDFEDY